MSGLLGKGESNETKQAGPDLSEGEGRRSGRSRHVQAGRVEGESSADLLHKQQCQSCPKCADIRTPGFFSWILVGSAYCVGSLEGFPYYK